MDATAQLGPVGAFRPLMYRTLIGLIASTGLRISEALNLCFKDIMADGLVIRETKFGKSRIVPLHPTTQLAIEDYLAERRKLATTIAGHTGIDSLHRQKSVHFQGFGVDGASGVNNNDSTRARAGLPKRNHAKTGSSTMTRKS